MSLLPTEDKIRKGLPLLKQIGYFPKALREITKVSVVNNVRYNPDRDPADINWARGKSTDQMGSAFRHIFEHEFGGVVFEVVPEAAVKATGITRVYVLAEAAWRLQAALELEIEKVEAEEFALSQVVKAADVEEVGDTQSTYAADRAAVVIATGAARAQHAFEKSAIRIAALAKREERLKVQAKNGYGANVSRTIDGRMHCTASFCKGHESGEGWCNRASGAYSARIVPALM